MFLGGFSPHLLAVISLDWVEYHFCILSRSLPKLFVLESVHIGCHKVRILNEPNSLNYTLQRFVDHCAGHCDIIVTSFGLPIGDESMRMTECRADVDASTTLD